VRRREATVWLLVASTACLLAVPSALAAPADAVISITSGPSGETTSRDATFTFGQSGRTGFDYATCDLDGGGESRCSSPATYSGLSLGDHRFIVRAHSSRGGLLGSDARSWRIVAGAPAPPPGPEPPPSPPPLPPPPPPDFEAKLELGNAVAPPGGLLELDASGSTGPITQFAFDIDGNGTYETKCGNPKAGTVSMKPGSYTVGVQITGLGGQTSTATDSFTVAGKPVLPPSGAKGASPPVGTAVGGCIAEADQGWIDTLLCPRTVVVGVAEATVPAASGACWQFTKPGAPLKGAHIQYVLKGGNIAYVNGIEVLFGGSKAIVDATTKRFLTVGGASVRIQKEGYDITILGKKKPLSWNVGKPGIVGDVSLGGFGHDFLGLDVPELTRPVKLTAAKAADLSLSVMAPFPLNDVASSSLSLHFDNTDGLRVDAFVASLGDFGLGPFQVKGLTIAYARQGADDVWNGSLSLGFPAGLTVGGHLRLRNGDIDELSLFLQKESPGFPIGCCVFMTYLSGAYDGTNVKATGHFTVGPSLGTPWGDVYMAAIKPGTLKVFLHTFFIHFEGDFRVVGKKFGSSWAWLSSKGFAFAGALNDSFSVAGVKVVEVGVIVEGSFSTNGSWFVGGNGSVCIFQIDCANGSLAISNNGVAGCLDTWVGLGGYVRWSDGAWGYYEDCSWDTTKSKAGALAVRLAPAVLDAVDVNVPRGASRRLFKIVGRNGPPRVVLVGPGGRRIEADSPVAASRHFVAQAPTARTTYVVVRRAEAGTWRISALPGSPQIVNVTSAGPLPVRLASASVRGSSALRFLDYELRGPQALRVTFVERGQNVHRVIGRARARKGSIRFAPAEAGGRARRIEAVVERDGLPVRTEVLARYTAPPLKPLPAPLVSVQRSRTTVVARWLPVAGAGGYHAVVTPGDGRSRFFRLPASRTSVRIAGVGLRVGATVSVRALSAEDRPGKLRRARLAPQPSVRVLSATRNAIAVRCLSGAAGICRATASHRGRTIATGSARLAYGQAGVVRARVAAKVRGPVTLHVDVPGEGRHVLRIQLTTARG
jgi:hypothetical protein